MEILYLIIFLLSIPLVWNVLLKSRLEACFKQGEIWAMRVTYILLSLVSAHLIASMFTTFISYCVNLGK